MWSQSATSQDRWDYSFHCQWEGMEFVGDSLIDITYDLVRGFVLVYGTWQPDSVNLELYVGSGLQEALRMQWNKGYEMGRKDELSNDWRTVKTMLIGVAIGAAVYYGITQIKAER